MNQSQRLAIVIPTRNRAEFLDHSLRLHIPLAERYGIPVFVSDNASTDTTTEVVEKWQKQYEFLYYHRNKVDLGETNFEVALKKPSTDFVWLLGDSMRIDLADCNHVLAALNATLEAAVVNDNSRVKRIASQVFTSHDDLLAELGWHMTQMSSLIFSKRIIDDGDFQSFYGSSFIQTGVIFEYLSRCQRFQVLWLPEVNVRGISVPGVEKKSWRMESFSIWLGKWPTFVLSLPRCYSAEAKLKAVVDHNRNTHVFRFPELIFLKTNRCYSLATLSKFRRVLRLTFGPCWIIRFGWPFLVPNRLLKWVARFG